MRSSGIREVGTVDTHRLHTWLPRWDLFVVFYDIVFCTRRCCNPFLLVDGYLYFYVLFFFSVSFVKTILMECGGALTHCFISKKKEKKQKKKTRTKIFFIVWFEKNLKENKVGWNCFLNDKKKSISIFFSFFLFLSLSLSLSFSFKPDTS